MSHQTVDAQTIADQATRLVREWLTTADQLTPSRAATLLAGVLSDDGGLEFTVGFVDGVIRPEDTRIAAGNLRNLARNAPTFLPWYLRAGLQVGAAASHIVPGIVVTVAQHVLRSLVGHLIVDASDARLGQSIAALKRSGRALNINLLGEAVLGPREAQRRLDGTRKLLQRDDVDYVSIKVSSTVAPHSPWAFDEAVTHVTEQLLPLYQYAASHQGRKFINLDMEEYRDLDLTIEVFTRLLDREDLLELEAGIVLQAYLPDAMAAMQRIQQWAAARRKRGGAPVKVRLVKGANLPMERVEAATHDWPLAVVDSKQAADTNYKRVLHYALTRERIDNVRLGVAGHNLFDIAYAWLLAGERSVRDGIEFEMLLGMAETQAEAVSRTVGGLLLYTPVVHPTEFDVAIAYLIRRLEEGASPDNFMSAVFDLSRSETLFTREQQRFLASLNDTDDTVPPPNRTQHRATDTPTRREEFTNTPDTDPALPGNRDWAANIRAALPTTTLGEKLVTQHTITTRAGIDAVYTAAENAAPTWAALTGQQRASILRDAAVELEKRRAQLIEVAAAECGKTIDQADPEISEAIDFANYYAHLAEQLDTIDGATPQPVAITLVTPPWNFPIAIPAGSVLAALAAGSTVVMKPATQARRCGSIVVDALWAAGVPRDVLHLVHVDEGDLGRALISDPRVGRLILTGAFDTAELFTSFNPSLQLLAETSGKNAIVVTPHADYDLAVKDIVTSAFGHAGQKCSAASLLILVGSAGTSQRLRNQLLDAVSGLRVGYPQDPTSQMGPIIEPAAGKLHHALTTLGVGETWAIEPQQLDDTGRLWSPGVKTGVTPGSEFHLTEYFGPVLGIMTVGTLAEAIAAQNATDFGLTAGLHSLNPEEIRTWVNSVEAGNLYVNRGITGAIVRRQPFGGWKRSAVGAGTKAGGPNYLFGLVDWEAAQASAVVPPAGAARDLLSAIGDNATELEIGSNELAMLRRAASSDAHAWAQEYSHMRDVSQLGVERNEFRYLPTDVLVRCEADASIAHLLRVVLAGVRAGSTMTVSAVRLPATVASLLGECGVTVLVQDSDAWEAYVAQLHDARIRLIGGARDALALASGGRADLALYAQPVTEAGRIELLPFLREQAISMTAHRFGTVQSPVNLT
ncbi:bifunctional proline dehydrogenase/L-glutamate gamma-semialdehyde dehydrogenase [Jonesia quinghaiensis]|uniref:bifunctional proline dehydrogenase/L-glutamate gamma-semialdehyde dehydrogenase n=1 Tax=Jonesia quinghaiensis TaxID=262806 RepID=UPI00041F3F46|nr:bifunctional proline dehydrogenase/L-glutamate gamma-semialdehyde dehydrogenase [Jonesia quinghaiensis]